MNTERLNRLMNTLLAAKMVAEKLDEEEPWSDASFRRRAQVGAGLVALIELVEGWQKEAIKMARTA